MTFPEGAIARVEHQKAHDHFVREVKPDYVMMKITHARRLMKNGSSFPEHYPDDVEVITTTTVADDKLNLIGWERDEEELKGFSELDIVKETQPDYHIPTDYSIYETMNEADQLEAAQLCAAGTRWMAEQTEDMDVTIIPQIKGRTKKQRRIFYDVMDDLETDYASFYATPYFTARGEKMNDLAGDIEKIAVEKDPRIMTIGAMSPLKARKFPTNVVAVSGQYQWRTKCEPRSKTPDEMRDAYAALEEDIHEALAHNPHVPETEE